MFEISPVLAGTFSAKDYVPASSNINAARATTPTDAATGVAGVTTTDSSVATTSATENGAGVDARRYTKFDRSAAESGEDTTFSFNDFLDAINPLQHIPVASSVYRAMTGEKINPVAHITGDLLYGGIFGGALAVLGGLGTFGDAMMEAQSGKDSTGIVLSSLFGDDGGKKIALAQNDAKPVDANSAVAEATPASSPLTPDQQIAALAAAAVASTPTAANPNPATAVKSDAVTSMTLAALPAPAATNGATAATATGDKGIPLDRSKLAYGGVMDTGNSMQAQNTAIALSESSHAMRLGHTIYTSRLMNGPHPLPVANATAQAADTTTTVTPAVAVTAGNNQTPSLATAVPVSSDIAKPSPQTNPLPQNLLDDIAMMKALGQYRGIANGATTPGANLDVTN